MIRLLTERFCLPVVYNMPVLLNGPGILRTVGLFLKRRAIHLNWQTFAEAGRVVVSLLIALLHIARENLKVVLAAAGRLRRQSLYSLIRGLRFLNGNRLSMVTGVLAVLVTVKALVFLAALSGFFAPSAGLVMAVDVLLLAALGSFFYLIGVVVHSLIRMERQGDDGLLGEGIDFGKLLALRSAIESSPEAFALWDKNQRMLISNTRFNEIYKLQEIGNSAAPSYQQFGARVNKLMMRPRRANKSFQAANYQAQLRNGRWLNIQERPTADGGQICVSFDVTNFKTVQQNLMIREKQMCSTVEDLRHSRRELEQKTQKLAELADKLMIEKNRAEEANQVKAEFLANISHELRTPLNAILGFSDLMHREVLGEVGNEKYKAYINDIHMSGAYLLQLINDILDMSRIEAGRLKLDRQLCQLSQLVDECLNLVGPQANSKTIQLSSNVETGLSCPLDKRAIKQVILNLLSNAVKFTPESGRVDLTALRAGDHIRIVVEDTGIGIERSQISLLGKPFVQVENQLTKSHPGTGLGLAISRSLVDLHGGDLTIRSEVGVGTTVEVNLPLVTPRDGEGQTSVSTLAA